MAALVDARRKPFEVRAGMGGAAGNGLGSAQAQACTASETLAMWNRYYDGRYYPFGHAYEYAIGTELSLLRRAQRRRYPDYDALGSAIRRSGWLMWQIAGGLYDRRRVDDGEVGQFARAVGTDIKTLRRIGVEAVERGAPLRILPDEGLAMLVTATNKDAELHPERYVESEAVGAGVRHIREAVWMRRKQLAKRSDTPREFIAALEHGRVPAELMRSPFILNLLDVLRVDMDGIRAIGSLVIESRGSGGAV